MTYVAVVVLFLLNLYTYNTVRWKMSRLCPAKKMSLIGKYRRNVIEWKETINLIVYFCLGALANVFCVRMFTEFETILQPEMIFLMSSLFWVTLLELPLLYLTVKLNFRVIPSVTVVSKPTEFYVLKPSFEPRRIPLNTPRSTNVFCTNQEYTNLSNSASSETRNIKRAALSSLQAKKVHGKLSLLQTINRQSTHMGKGKSKGKSIGKAKGKITPVYVSRKYESHELTAVEHEMLEKKKRAFVSKIYQSS